MSVIKTINDVEHDKCCGCFACYNSCLSRAITFSEDAEGFMYPHIDNEKCVNCGKCYNACPVIDKKENLGDIKLSYGAYLDDENILKNSSSGGIFSALASKVIDKKGVVFGAVFNKEFEVYHTFAKTQDELKKMYGSKYSQSEIGDSFSTAKKFLNEGKLVYFSGTPCQIEGLYGYLGKDYDNLITQDIVCHGVPSPKVWRHYLNNHLSFNNIDAVNFRSKENGWQNYKLKITADGKKYIPKENIYMKGYIANLFLRKSCHNCEFKSKSRHSDITLGDFWGCESSDKEIFNFYGTSFVVLHSEKGKKLFSAIKDSAVIKQVDFEKAITQNKSYYLASTPHKYRQKFIKKLSKKDFAKTVNKKTNPSFAIKCVNKVKLVLNKK